jgi:hypothetical protein
MLVKDDANFGLNLEHGSSSGRIRHTDDRKDPV